MKPGAGVGPVALGGGRGNVERGGRFFNRHADKVPELDEVGFRRINGGEFFQGVVDGEQLVILPRGGHRQVRNVHAVLAATVTQGAFAAGVVDEDAAHGFGGGGKEMRPVLPARVGLANEAQVGFVDERGGLQRLPGRFVRHLLGSQPAQFIVHHGQQFLGRF